MKRNMRTWDRDMFAATERDRHSAAALRSVLKVGAGAVRMSSTVLPFSDGMNWIVRAVFAALIEV